MGQFYLLSWLRPLFTGFSKCPPVRLSCQASIERQMLPPLPTPLTGPLLWMLHAQGSWEVKVSFHLILLGKAIVGRGGFRTEVPNCPKMGKQIRRADSQAVGVTGHCHRVSSLFFGNQYFFFSPTVPGWTDHETWLIWALFPHLWREGSSDDPQGLLCLGYAVCVPTEQWEAVWASERAVDNATMHPSEEMKALAFFIARVHLVGRKERGRKGEGKCTMFFSQRGNSGANVRAGIRDWCH